MDYSAINNENDVNSIQMFFEDDEWGRLSLLEKRRFMNIKRNYDMMNSAGLCPKVPEFMRNKRKTTSKTQYKFDKQECNDGMSELTQMVSDMRNMNAGWPAEPPTPAQKSLLKEIGKKVCKVDWSRYEVRFSRKEKAHISDLLKSAEKHLKYLQESLRGNGESSCVRRYPKRQVPAVCYAEEKVPSEDEWLYCEHCEREYEGDCPIHGPMLRVRDKKVAPGYTADRAFRTCPDFLSVCRSGIRGAGLGIWTEIPLSKGLMFGPYVGKIITDRHQAEISGYAWEIRRGGKVVHYVEGSDPSASNWLRFVNCAQTEEQQNLVAFQYSGKIFYRTYKPVMQFTELLVWYGDQYAADLGIDLEEDLAGGTRVDDCQIMSTSRGLRSQVARSSGQITPRLSTYERVGWQPSAQDSIRKRTIVESRRKMPICIYCGENFKDKWSLTLHRRGHEELDMPAKVISENRSDQRAPTSDNKTMLSSSSERREGAVNLGNNIYECPHCEYRATGSSDLKRHVNAIHLGRKPYNCPHCEYRATRSDIIKSHVTAVHLGQKPYKCPHCEYRAAESGNLKRHVTAVHLEQKPYKCPHCEYTATQSGHVKRHVTAVHLEQKPYKCPHCEYRAARTDSIKSHVTAMHFEQKPYKCPHCEYRAAHSGNLKRHVTAMHFEQKPYKCPHCEYRATQSGNHKRHVTAKHLQKLSVNDRKSDVEQEVREKCVE